MSITNENKTKTKLENKLEVNFSDYAIDSFSPSFKFTDEGGEYTKDQLTIRLGNLGPTLKGLKYNFYRKTKN